MTDKSIPYRRFGRTGIDMPLLSLGGMRFQYSWEDVDPSLITNASQGKLKVILETSKLNGLHHIETARHYGTSERQLGWAMKECSDLNRIIQSKVPPNDDPKLFEEELKLTFERLQCERLDLLAIHGINLPEHLDQTLRLGGCMDVARAWQDRGLIKNIGFSTHGSSDLIVEAIQSNEFDYVNLHWYFIYQENEIALEVAKEKDLGVFVISPTDKGGHLHTPSDEFLELCEPLHPIVFNDLFCLSDSRVHTISVGISRIEDLDLHLEAISLLETSSDLLKQIERRLLLKAESVLGANWLATWDQGLPNWKESPGKMNIHILLWLYNLVEAWGMEHYAKSRYNLLGNAGHWFPGNNANLLDNEISEDSLREALSNSPWSREIPEVLRNLRERLNDLPENRLSSA